MQPYSYILKMQPYSYILKIIQERAILLLMDPFSVFLVLLLSLSLLFLYKLISPTSTPKKNLPPSPPRLPIIGNLHQLGTLPFRSLQTLSQKHGDLMLLYFGSKPTIVISSAEVASQVLKTHDLTFANRPWPNSSIPRRLLRNGNEMISSSYDENFKQLRKLLMLHFLGSNKVRSYGEARREEVALMVKNIDAQVLTTVNLGDLFTSLSIGLTCRLAFGKKYSASEDGRDFRKTLDSFFELLGGFNIGDFISWLGWINKINGVEAKLNNVISSFDLLLERILEDHSISAAERSAGDGSRAKDFIDFLLQVQGDADTLQDHLLDRESIKGLIMDVLVGGTQTSSVDIEWMMSELLRNPTAMQELQKEVSRVVGGKANVTKDDLEKMDYLKAVHKETLRLHPPAPLLVPHISTEDTVINGYKISAGTQAIVNAWAICRNPNYWEEAERFYPERFLNSQVDFKGRDFQFTPFGSGRRMCPGMGYATALVELAVANLVHHFDWSLPDGVKPEALNMVESHGTTSPRAIPLHAIPSPRNR